MWSHHNFRRPAGVAIFFVFLQASSTFLHLLCLLLKAVDRPNFCVMSVSLRGLCVCLLSTWQHWISTGNLSTRWRLTVHLGSAHWITWFITSIQNKRFFGSWPAQYSPCSVSRGESFSAALVLRPISNTLLWNSLIVNVVDLCRVWSPSFMALQTVEHYVLYPTLSCSACYTPGHASYLTNVFNTHRIFWIFRHSVTVPFCNKNVPVAHILDVTVLGIVKLISSK